MLVFWVLTLCGHADINVSVEYFTTNFRDEVWNYLRDLD
jgi:hypothetical protein